MSRPNFDSKFEETFLKGIPRGDSDRKVVQFIAKNDPFQKDHPQKK